MFLMRALIVPSPTPPRPARLTRSVRRAQVLLNRLKQLAELKHRVLEKEHEITDMQMEIQAMLEAKAQERDRTISPDYSALQPEPEALPVPAAMIHHGNQQSGPHPGKRQGTNAVSCEYPLRECEHSAALRFNTAGCADDSRSNGTARKARITLLSKATHLPAEAM